MPPKDPSAHHLVLFSSGWPSGDTVAKHPRNFKHSNKDGGWGARSCLKHRRELGTIVDVSLGSARRTRLSGGTAFLPGTFTIVAKKPRAF